MSDLLDGLRHAQALDLLDLHFARAIGRLAGSDDPALLAAAALANRAPTHGHVCADLAAVAAVLERELGLDAEADEDTEDDRVPLPDLPDPDTWIAAVRAVRGAVRSAGETRPSPLVLDGGALYLDRYWQYEDRLARAVLRRVADPITDLPPAVIREGLDRLFEDEPFNRLPRLACATALLNRFTVVSGGPGTGKTSVVVRMLALLNHVARQRDSALPRVLLVAPTGKAAARLTESIRVQLSDARWVPSDMQGDIDATSSTIHSALGVIRIELPRFRHNADNPLPADVVVVDEASMIDLPLMAKLVDAVPEHARLILLGDPDQLVSVEMGAVLGDVCGAAHDGERSRGSSDLLRATGARLPEGEERTGDRGLADVHVHVEHTWRYDAASGIKALADAIQAEDGKRVVELLDGDAFDDVKRIEPPTSQRGWRKLLEGELVKRYTPAVAATEPEAALKALGGFRVLCAHRRGVRGVGRVNGSVETWLEEAKKIRTSEEWYPGRPVMVTRNDRALNLRNGDVGVVLPDPEDADRRLAWFPGDQQGELRSFRPAALPEHDTVYATTVHKAQGSEYDEVLVILPDRRSPVVTRELLYTSVTRAKNRVRVLGKPEVVEAAVATTIERMTGLRRKLQRPSPESTGSALHLPPTPSEPPTPPIPTPTRSNHSTNALQPPTAHAATQQEDPMHLLSPLPTAQAYLEHLQRDLEGAKVVRFAMAYVSEGGLDRIGLELVADALKQPDSFGVASLSCACGFSPLVTLQALVEPVEDRLRYFMDPQVLDTDGDPELSLVHSKAVYIVRADGRAVVYLGSHNWTGRGLGPDSPRNVEASVRMEVEFDPQHLTGTGSDFASQINRHLLQCFRLGASVPVHPDNIPVFADWYRARCEREKPLPLDEYAVVIGACVTDSRFTYDHLWNAILRSGASIYLPCHREDEGQILRQRQDRVLLMAWTSKEALEESREPVLLFCKVTRQVAGRDSTYEGTSEGDIRNFDLVLHDPVQAQRIAGGEDPGDALTLELKSGQFFEYFELSAVDASTTAARIDGTAAPRYQNYLQVYKVLLPEWLKDSTDPRAVLARDRMLGNETQPIWSAANLALTTTRHVQAEVSKNYRVRDSLRAQILACFEELGLDAATLRVRPVDPEVAPKELVRLAESRLHHGYIGDKAFEAGDAFYAKVRPGRLAPDLGKLQAEPAEDEEASVEPRVQQLYAERLRVILENVGITDADLEAWESKPPKRRNRTIDTVRLRLYELEDAQQLTSVMNQLAEQHREGALRDYAMLRELLLLAVSVQDARMTEEVGAPVLRSLFETTKTPDTGFFSDLFVQSVEGLAAKHCANGWPSEPQARRAARSDLNRFLKSQALGDEPVWQLLCLEYLKGTRGQ